MYDLFDNLDEQDTQETLKTFFKVDKLDDKEKLSWLLKVKNLLLEEAKSRTATQRANLAMYRGIAENPYDRRREYLHTKRLSKVQKFIVNHLYDLTETKVSQMTKLKPAVEILPSNDEWNDRTSAKVVGLLIKHLWYINNIDYLIQQMHRHCRIFGESFSFVTWNKDSGDLHPDYIKLRDNKALLESLLGENGTDSDTPIKTGDVEYELEVPWRVLLQRATCFDKSEYVFRIKIEDTAELKEDYKNLKEKIKATSDLKVFDLESGENKFVENKTVVYYFYHKKTKYIPEGKFIKFTKDTILEQGDLPFSHGSLPLVRLTDLDVPEVLNGVSRYETVSNIQKMYNNISTLIAKNIYLTAHAKWMMPRGAAKIEQLGNDNTIVQYQGPVAPALVQAASNPPEVYAFRQQLKEEMQTIYGSHGISRGEVPKGITAASALQFLNELENERASTDIAKHGFLVKDLAKMTLSVAGDNYDMSDGRMLRVVGKNNQYLIRHFDAANLNKDYDIRVDNSTGLPESKAAKIQRILEVMQRAPQLFSPERWEELLEFGNTDRMIKLSTEAIRSADSENEDIMAGEYVAQPEDFEDHIAHWESHVKAMQSRAFKEESSNEVMDNMREHLFWTEELMIEKMSTNPLFQSKIANLKLFPIFYHGDMGLPQSAQQQEAMVQGQANRGDQITGQIPGTDNEDMMEVNNGQ